MAIRALETDDLQKVREILSEHTLREYTENATTHVEEHLDDEDYINIVFEQDGDVVGFGTCIVYGSDTVPSEFDIRHPSIVRYPRGTLGLLKYGYVKEELTGQGIGTQIVRELTKRAIDTHDIDALFAETWVKPNKKSSDQLLEKLGFTQAYRADDYYADYDEQASGECTGCGNQIDDCACSGAIYMHEEPNTLLDD